MSKDDLLDDLEDIVDSDWKKVFEKFQDEEYKKEIGEPVIPNYPSYGEFYQTLVELVTHVNIPSQLAMLIHNVLAYQDRKKSESFDNIWSLFCDPHKHRIENIQCSHCNKHQTIVFSRQNLSVFRPTPPHRFSGRAWDRVPETSMKQETVHCIKCGIGFYYVAGKLIGVFDNRRIE
jgi:hypothetical protein